MCVRRRPRKTEKVETDIQNYDDDAGEKDTLHKAVIGEELKSGSHAD